MFSPGTWGHVLAFRCPSLTGIIAKLNASKLGMITREASLSRTILARTSQDGTTIGAHLTTMSSRAGRPKPSSRVALITENPKEVVPFAQVIIFSLPAFACEEYLRVFNGLIRPGTILGAMPAQGGFDMAVRDCLQDVASSLLIFGLDTLPWACRFTHYGSEAEVLTTKNDISLACSPESATPTVLPLVQSLVGPLPRLTPVGSILNLTIMNPNAIAHPCLTYGRFHAWDGTTPFATPPLLYQGVDEFAGELLCHVRRPAIQPTVDPPVYCGLAAT